MRANRAAVAMKRSTPLFSEPHPGAGRDPVASTQDGRSKLGRTFANAAMAPHAPLPLE